MICGYDMHQREGYISHSCGLLAEQVVLADALHQGTELLQALQSLISTLAGSTLMLPPFAGAALCAPERFKKWSLEVVLISMLGVIILKTIIVRFATRLNGNMIGNIVNWAYIGTCKL